MFEVNLVPDVKAQMLKTQKVRNVVCFICGIIVAVSAILILVFGLIKGGQDITMSSQDERLEQLSSKVNSFGELNELLTLQNQLNGLAAIADEKVVLTRVFSILNVLRPTNGDTISISDLSINVEGHELRFDAQADAGVEPFIDYRVLDAFKKSMPMMKFDYGRYVDGEGNEIPVVCLIETDEGGNLLNENGELYAIWTKGVDGCNPSKEGSRSVVRISEKDVEAAKYDSGSQKIWRTPQFSNWFSSNDMTENGEINGVPHFKSECISYSRIAGKWTSENTCNLIPEDITVSDSSNARNSSGELVLRFSAQIKYNPDVLLAKNKHMITVAPSGYTNVTDSYMQIQGMFKEAAVVCAEDDVDCLNS